MRETRATVSFEDHEVEVLKALAEQYDQVNDRVSLAELAERVQMDREPLQLLLKRFARYGVVKSGDLLDSQWKILPQIAAVSTQLRRPKPPRDYYNDLAVWFRSKWWSVPLILVAVGLPAAYGYVSMVLDLYKLLSPSQ